MKRLIFIDNDDESRAIDELQKKVLPALKHCGIFPDKDIEIIDRFWDCKIDNLYNDIFSNENIIAAWSVYTRGPLWHSGKQILNILATAGCASVTGATFIDFSGMVMASLDGAINAGNLHRAYDVLKGIQLNNIITFTGQQTWHRVVVNITADSAFALAPVELPALFVSPEIVITGRNNRQPATFREQKYLHIQNEQQTK